MTKELFLHLFVTALLFQADVSANVLFERQDDHQVFQCFPAVVNQLELYLNQLITVYTQLEEKDKGLLVWLFV